MKESLRTWMCFGWRARASRSLALPKKVKGWDAWRRYEKKENDERSRQPAQKEGVHLVYSVMY